MPMTMSRIRAMERVRLSRSGRAISAETGFRTNAPPRAAVASARERRSHNRRGRARCRRLPRRVRPGARDARLLAYVRRLGAALAPRRARVGPRREDERAAAARAVGEPAL